MTEHRIAVRAIGSKFDNTKWEAARLLRIGRVGGVEVVLDDTSVSRNHAEIVLSNDEWLARDLGSTNGTYLNGARLGRTGQPVRPRDLLQCGNVVLRIEPVVVEEGLDFTETPCGSLQVQAVAQQTVEEAAHNLASEMTRSSRPGEQLLNLLRAGHCLDLSESIDDLLARNLQETVAALGARRGAVVLIDTKTGKLNLRAVHPPRPDQPPARIYSQTLARRCVRTGQSLLCADVVKDPELLEANSVAGSCMASVICALLRSHRRYLGVLHLDRGPNDEPFTRDDLCRADALAANMSFAFESALQMQERQQAMFIQTVVAFSQIIELRDPYTGGHAQRVTDYALLLADQLKLPEADLELIRIGAPLHDIGKIGIDDAVLRKTTRLSAEEFELMKSHTVKGAVLIQTLPGLDEVLPIVRSHHERWDGQGYPDQLAGEQIPHLARLMAVADTFDAMTTDRPYRLGMPLDQALAQIEAGAGSQFDATFAQAFLRLRPILQEQLKRKDALAQTIDAASLFLSGAGARKHGMSNLRRPANVGLPA
jgi:putative nucleotidyltransferase with HDIG domain